MGTRTRSRVTFDLSIHSCESVLTRLIASARRRHHHRPPPPRCRSPARAYNLIVAAWTTDTKASIFQRIDKSIALTNRIGQGAKSCSLTHVSEYVEETMDLNRELEGTDFYLKV